MSGSLGQQFPNRQTAWVDPVTGIMNPVSYYMVRSLWQRTGGGTATATSNQMQASIVTNTAAIALNTASIVALPTIYAPLASPHLVGVPTAPTAALATNTTQIATTAFVFNGFIPAATQITTSLNADVALNNVALFFTGPSIAQGLIGTWFASGSVTVQDTAGAALFNVKLWDGVTVIASGVVSTTGASASAVVSLSGVIAIPGGNIRISVQDATTVNGKILFNLSGVSKDASVSAFRVA